MKRTKPARTPRKLLEFNKLLKREIRLATKIFEEGLLRDILEELDVEKPRAMTSRDSRGRPVIYVSFSGLQGNEEISGEVSARSFEKWSLDGDLEEMKVWLPVLDRLTVKLRREIARQEKGRE